jgi:hypothetical protein
MYIGEKIKSLGIMKKVFLILASACAIFFAACGDDGSSASFEDTEKSLSSSYTDDSSDSKDISSSSKSKSSKKQDIDSDNETENSDSKDKGSKKQDESSSSKGKSSKKQDASSDSKSGNSDSKKWSSNGIDPRNIVVFTEGYLNKGKSRNQFLLSAPNTGECKLNETKTEKSVSWEPVDRAYEMNIELEGDKIFFHLDSGVTCVLVGGSAENMDGTWTTDSVIITQESSYSTWIKQLDCILEISNNEFALTLAWKEDSTNVADSSEIEFQKTRMKQNFFTSDLMYYICLVLNGESNISLYIDDLFTGSIGYSALVSGNSKKFDITYGKIENDIQTFTFNGTTYTATLDSCINKEYQGREIFVTVTRDDTICKWHQVERYVTREYCNNRNIEHLNTDKLIYSQGERVVTKYWEGNKDEFEECLKNIATPPADSL